MYAVNLRSLAVLANRRVRTDTKAYRLASFFICRVWQSTAGFGAKLNPQLLPSRNSCTERIALPQDSQTQRRKVFKQQNRTTVKSELGRLSLLCNSHFRGRLPARHTTSRIPAKTDFCAKRSGYAKRGVQPSMEMNLHRACISQWLTTNASSIEDLIWTRLTLTYLVQWTSRSEDYLIAWQRNILYLGGLICLWAKASGGLQKMFFCRTA